MPDPSADTCRDSPPAAGRPPPRFGTVLTGHVLFTLLNYVLLANTAWVMPMLVRLRFGADDPDWRDWQTTLVTAAVPTFMIVSVFWGELLRRISLRKYLVLYWLTAVLPYLCVAFVQDYWQLLACQIVASFGWAGWPPLDGKLLRHLYTDAIRGRVYAVLNVVRLGSGVAAVYAVGRWLEIDENAFRVFFVAAAGIQVVAMVVLVWLIRHSRADEGVVRERTRSWTTLLRPIVHMGTVLRADRTFLRYEIAFMVYGAAFMFCEALLPVLATTRLGMRYEDYAHSTQAIARMVMLLMMFPMGWLLDRIGPIRTSGIAFGTLMFYPLLLMVAGSSAGVGLASGVFGFGLAGVMMGWMLGPVMLARTPDQVPQYVAIHTTLVGVRGVLFQALAMLLYKLTGSFTWPLTIAGLAFLCAALQMWRLQRTISRPPQVAISEDVVAPKPGVMA